MVLRVTPDANYLQVCNASTEEINQLQILLKKRIKNWRWHPKVKKKVWDGYLQFFQAATNRIPVGLWWDVLKNFQDYGLEVEIENFSELISDISMDDFRAWLDVFFKDGDIEGRFPRDFQIDAIYNILKYVRSTSEIATSAGKTMIIFLVFCYLKEHGMSGKFLLITPNIPLITQAIADFDDYSKNPNEEKRIDYRVQVLTGDEEKIRKSCDIIIGTFHTLRNLPAEFFDDVEAVCVDEAHFTQTVSIKSILTKISNAKYRFGLSGTLGKEDDADTYTIKSHLGPRVNQIDPSFLFQNNFATPVFIKILYLNYRDAEFREKLSKLFYSDLRKTDPTKLLDIERRVVLEDDVRFDWLINLIKRVTKNTLVMFKDIKNNYGRRIFETLRSQLGVEYQIYYIDGGTDSDLRSFYQEEMRKTDGVIRILVASYGTFSTGISIPNLYNLILAESYKSEKIVKQTIGRMMRLMENKDRVNVMDIVDDFSIRKFKNYAIKHADERIRIYQDAGYNFSCHKINLT